MTRRLDTDRDRGVPGLVLERYRLGELPAAEAEALERRLEAEPDLAARLAALDRSDEEIRRLYPPAWLADQVRSRRKAAPDGAARPAWGWLLRWPVPAALAAAATIALVLAPRLLSPPALEPVAGARPAPSALAVASGDRIKGLQPSLVLFRKTGSGSEALADGAVARAGDVVRVGYRAAGRTHGVIVSVDGRGLVTVHLPTSGSEAAPLRSGETVLLDRAYELDDAPHFERFYLVTADRDFEVEAVVEAARRVAGVPAQDHLMLPAPLQQTSFLLRKGGQP
jgi:anti-sigma factor RsiW